VSLEPDLEAMLTETVSVEPFVSQDELGAATYGEAVSVKARIEAIVGRRTNAPGEEGAPAAGVFMAPTMTNGAPLALSPRDRITLPARYSPRVPKVLSVFPANDEDGLHHYEVRVLMQESALRRQITIDRPVTSRDEQAREETIAWAPLATISADVRPIGGEERFGADQRLAWGMVQFRADYVADVGPKNRIRYAGRVFDILDARVLGQQEGLEILAKARAE
jgi:SPP1 family predicted phage head-tail adaptor